MARNRIIHNVQDVFVGSAPDETDALVTGIADHQILKRLTRVQNFNYSIEASQEDSLTLGKSKAFSRESNQPTSVSLSLSYFLNGVDNERRIGLNVGSIEDRIYTSDFSAGVPSNDGWATSSATFDYPETTVCDPSDCYSVSPPAVKITANTSEAYHRAYRDVGTVAGKKYKVTASVWIPSIGTNVAGFQFRYANGTSGPIIHPTPDTWYDFSCEYTALDNDTYDGWIEFWMANSSSVDTTSTFLWAGASNDYMYIKNVVVTEVKCLTHDTLTSDTKDRRNLYLSIKKDQADMNQREAFPDSFELNKANVENSQPNDCGLLAFQNCYLTQYDLSITPASLPTVSLSYVSDNMIGYTSGSGIGIPVVSAADASVTESGTKIILPKPFSEGAKYTSDYTKNYSHTNVTISKASASGINEFINDAIVSCTITASIDRDTIGYVGNKLFNERPPIIPMQASLDLETIATGNLSGSYIDNLKENENYDVVIDVKNVNQVTLAKYTFSGAKLLTLGSDSNISENKTASMTFDAYMAVDEQSRNEGLFVTGLITSAISGSNNVIYPQF